MKLQRDNISKAVLVKDNESLWEYQKSRNKRRQKDQRIMNLEDRLLRLELLMEKISKK